MLVLISIIAFLFPHDLHLSIGNISYNSDQHRMEIEQRIFFDDLETSFKSQLQDKNFNILSPNSSNYDYDSLFISYLNKNIQITLENKPIKLSLLEYEADDEAFVFFLYAENIPSINTINLYSSILFEMFEGQTNIVSVKINGIKKSEKFRKGSKGIEMTF